MSTSVRQALTAATARLREAGIDSAALDARLLLQHATRLSREAMLLDDGIQLDADQQKQLSDFLDDRCARKPVSKIIGMREFWSLPFRVTEDTLDPRPDSETLIEAVLDRIDDKTRERHILDLGTGTGCLLLSLLSELPHAHGIGVDLSPAALDIAKDNARNLNLSNRSDFIASNWFENVEGTFDIILSNPPYIPTADLDDLEPEVTRFDPLSALDGGQDGLDAYRLLSRTAPAFLKEGGLLAFELGILQADDVANLLETAGFRAIERCQDLAGITRVLIATK